MTTGLAVAFAISGVAAAQASAAAIAVTQACVVNANPAEGSPMTVNGTGFTAGDSINLQTVTGDAFGTATADVNGNFTATFAAPTLSTPNPAAGAFTLQAMDETDGVTTASTTFDVANLAVATNPARAKPNKKVTWSFSGFTSGAQIYAHYLHGKKVTATMRFGRAGGPCGVLKTRKVFYPGHAKYGSYKIQIDDARRYSATTLPRLVATLKTHLTL
ncbi:MAG TPA: hypothetical protein VIJ20_00505 [Solirubrobacteraceae bacterium]